MEVGELYRRSVSAGRCRQTGRHLDEVPAEAEAAGAVFLVDEADALFTQGRQVPDSDAWYEPSELDALLDRLSVFPGQVLVLPAARGMTLRTRRRFPGKRPPRPL